MAKIIITLEDTGENLIQYKSECNEPQETDSKGEPTLALKMGAMIMQQIMALNEPVEQNATYNLAKPIQ